MGLPIAGRGQGHSWHRQGMQSGPMTCLARQAPCSRPGLLHRCQRAGWTAESEGPSLGWTDDSVCVGAFWELGPWTGSCRNSGSTRSSFRRRPLWSWAPLLCTRFSSSTRPGSSHSKEAHPHRAAYVNHLSPAASLRPQPPEPALMSPRPLSQPCWSQLPGSQPSSFNLNGTQSPVLVQSSLLPPSIVPSPTSLVPLVSSFHHPPQSTFNITSLPFPSGTTRRLG